MLKKAAILTAGVGVTLLAASPLAYAGDSTDNGGGDHDHGHSKHHGHGHGDHKGNNNTKCVAESGDVKANDTKGLLAGVGPILNGNAGQIASCNSFLNDNFSHNHVSALNDLHL